MNKLLLVMLVMLIMSIVTFAAMGIDKSAAKAGTRRIPEKTLFGLALFGGALGGLFGMRVFHHKTKHASFKIGMPLLLIFNIAAYIFFTR